MYLKKAIEYYLKNFDLDSFLQLSLIDREDGNYVISRIPGQIFGTYFEYGEFLKTLDVSKSKYLEEYLLFMDSFFYCEGNVAATQFNFKVIPVLRDFNQMVPQQE